MGVTYISHQILFKNNLENFVQPAAGVQAQKSNRQKKNVQEYSLNFKLKALPLDGYHMRTLVLCLQGQEEETLEGK